MSLWEAKGLRKCTKCGTSRLVESLSDGCCADAEWCDRQRAVPTRISATWAAIEEDLRTSGASAFEVDGRRFMLVDIGRTGELVGEVAEETLYHAPLDFSRFSPEKGFTYTAPKKKVSNG